MGWLDVLLRTNERRKAITGIGLTGTQLRSAVEGGLQKDYELMVGNARQQRGIDAAQKDRDKQIASSEKMAADRIALERELAGNRDALEREMMDEKMSLYDREMSLKESIQDSNNLSSMIGGGLDIATKYGPKVVKGLGGLFSTQSAAGQGAASAITLAPEAGGSAASTGGGVFGASDMLSSAAPEIASTASATPVVSEGVYASAIETAGLFGSTGAAATASISSGLGALNAGTAASYSILAGTGAASPWATGSGVYLASQFGATGAAGALSGTAAGTAAGTMASTGFMSAIGGAISAVCSFVPFIGIAFALVSFLAPNVFTEIGNFFENVRDVAMDVYEGVMEPVVETVWEVVTAPFDWFFGDGSVICTELNRQGFIPDDVLWNEHVYVRYFYDEEAYLGYRMFGDKIAEKMKTSKLLTTIIKPFGVAVAYEFASRIDNDTKGSLFGKTIITVSKPICKMIYKVFNNVMVEECA